MLRFSSAQAKIHQSPHVNLETKVNTCSNFASFFIVITKKSLVNFKLRHFLLWIKKSYQIPNFETFKCSGESFPNLSCQLWKQKSIFLQILHQYSLPSNITPLYFLNSNIIYFRQRQPIMVEIFEIFKCLDQNSSKSSCQFWNEKQIPFPILYLFSFSWQNLNILFQNILFMMFPLFQKYLNNLSPECWIFSNLYVPPCVVGKIFQFTVFTLNLYAMNLWFFTHAPVC